MRPLFIKLHLSKRALYVNVFDISSIEEIENRDVSGKVLVSARVFMSGTEQCFYVDESVSEVMEKIDNGMLISSALGKSQ